MDAAWAKRLLFASKRKDEVQEREFLQLVDEAEGRVTLEVARVLMKTFSDEPDYETQENVLSVLAENREAYVIAMLEELPRLAFEAPDWARSLVGTEVEHQPELLVQIASRMPEKVKAILRGIIGRADFCSFHPAAGDVLDRLK